MTAAEGSLLHLCALAGVAPSYRDPWSNEHPVSPETLRAILAAMGIGTATERDVAASIIELEHAQWRSLLPPVVTFVVGETASVPVTLADGAAERRLHWVIDLEAGERREGWVALDSLTVLAEWHDGRRRLVRLALPIAELLPMGYHRLAATVGEQTGDTTLIAAPARCYLPRELDQGGSAWGLTTQLYALRSARDWGIGDFGGLATLSIEVARRGGRTVGINPLHALFPAAPRHASPYSPSSRLFLNPLYIDVASVPDVTDDCLAAAGSDVASARATSLVDHEAVAARKRPVFERLYRDFAQRHLGAVPSARGEEFRRFQRDGGRTLGAYAIFSALHEHMLARGESFCWRDWPVALREAGSPEVARFAAEHRAHVELQEYLQWEAERQLADAARVGAEAGLTLGLYRDLAVGVDPNGAEAWADPMMTVTGASVGAPPDMLNLKGQDWGLAPVSPVALGRAGYAPFIAALRANMNHAGILRIDHVMALQHLYWVPRGASAVEGAYVSYPLADLRRILALESWRRHCAVIGEDLGTVPAGFREAMAESAVLSYRVLVFERNHDGGFLSPERYPALATASFSTHDIATLRGFWLGRDIDWRRTLDLYPNAEAAEEDRQERRRTRRRLLEALIRAAALPPEAAARLLPDDDDPVYAPELAEAVYRFLGHSPARLVLLPIEDALGETEQANLPGTIAGHPNWQRKLSLALEEIAGNAAFGRVASALDEARQEL
jgi:4-alpha-glucanotransferase